MYTASAADCVRNGASYLFWIKILNTTQGFVFTSTAWDSHPKEGISFMIQNRNQIQVAVFRKGNAGENNRLWAHINQPLNVGFWYHVVLVWYTDPNIEVYYDGASQGNTITGDSVFQSNPYACLETTGRMVFGKHFVNRGSDSANFLIDEFKLFDFTMPADQAKAKYMEYEGGP